MQDLSADPCCICPEPTGLAVLSNGRAHMFCETHADHYLRFRNAGASHEQAMTLTRFGTMFMEDYRREFNLSAGDLIADIET